LRTARHQVTKHEVPQPLFVYLRDLVPLWHAA
jgi:hypothetical protein